MTPRNINKIIEDADQRQIDAINEGNRAKGAAARQERRCAVMIKRELVGNNDLPDTPDPPRKPKPRPKLKGGGQVPRQNPPGRARGRRA